VTERGIGCDECEGRGYIVNGPDTGVDNCTSYYPCPNCTPPDVPERDLTEDEEDAALAEAEAIW
jgi:hypothetical protein